MSQTAFEDQSAPLLVEQQAAGVDAEFTTFNQRVFAGLRGHGIALGCIAYTVFHITVMNVFPMEPWAYRLLHIGGGLVLGFLLFAAQGVAQDAPAPSRSPASLAVLAAAAAGRL
ncbi:hypothetical protein BH23PSE1_BH23PSE1_07990 [soil metagenome]